MMLYFIGILWRDAETIRVRSQECGFHRNIAQRGRNRMRVISQGDYAEAMFVPLMVQTVNMKDVATVKNPLFYLGKDNIKYLQKLQSTWYCSDRQ